MVGAGRLGEADVRRPRNIVKRPGLKPAAIFNKYCPISAGSERRPRASMIRESGDGCFVSAMRTRRRWTMNRPVAAAAGSNAEGSAC
jgi:hypothetical protein